MNNDFSNRPGRLKRIKGLFVAVAFALFATGTMATAYAVRLLERTNPEQVNELVRITWTLTYTSVAFLIVLLIVAYFFVRNAFLNVTDDVNRFTDILDQVPLILFSIDKNGKVTVSEGRGLEALGLDPGEVVGRSVYDMYADTPEVEESVRKVLSGETMTRRITVQRITFEVSFFPLEEEDGSVSGLFGIARNVSAR